MKTLVDFSKILIAFAAIVTITACDIFDDDDDDVVSNPPVASAKVQAIHASPDAPKVNLYANGTLLQADFDYGLATPRLEVDAGILNLDVQGILPDGSTPSVIGPVDLSLNGNFTYTVLAVNPVADIEPLIITRETTAITAGELRAQVIHAAPNAPMVDVYVTAPEADLNNEAALGTFSFKDSLGPVDIPEGDYQIRVTVAGDPSSVVFDSGTVSLTAGLDLTLAAIENTATGSAPIQLLVATNEGSFVIHDVSTPSDIRVVHASPDAPAVDVRVNDSTLLFSDLSYGQATDFASVPGDSYNVKVVPTGTTTPAVIDADLTLEQSISYTVIAVDLLSNIEPLVLTEDRRRIATEARLQVVHASPAAGNVDIYLTEPGADITDQTPAISNFPFKATTDGFISLPAGDYDVTVTATGSKDPAIGPANITLAAGNIYTIIARDAQRLDANDSGLPLGVILLDDFSIN
jgi:hypothetical protein